MTHKKGVSLITLIITIVIVLILSAVIVLIVINNNTISDSGKAKFQSDMRSFQHVLNMKIFSEMSVDPEFDQFGVNATLNPEDETVENILDVIPQVEGEYEKKVEVESSKIIYSGNNYKEKVWSCEIGIDVKGESCDDLIVDVPDEDDPEKIVEHDFVVSVGGVSHYQPNISQFNKEVTYYLTYFQGTEVKTSIKEEPPEDWYNYAEKKWANILIENNGRKLYLVWIPRYAYQIKNYANKSFGSTPPGDLSPIDIKFVDKTNLDLNNEGVVHYNDPLPVVENNSQTNYVLHPAFTVNRSDTEQENVELGGIWVSKFESTDIKVRLTSFKIDGMLNSTTVKVTTVPFEGAGIIPYTYEYYINDSKTPAKVGLATESISGLTPNAINTITVKAKDADGIYTAPLTRAVLMIDNDNDKDMNAPDLTGFNPDTTYYLTFNFGVEHKKSIKEAAPTDWYNYKEKQWANIVTENNGKKLYLVWIPRYEYRIHSLSGNDRGQMDIQFIKTSKTIATDGYTIHPAFTLDRSDTAQGKLELPGIWVSKFESTDIKARLSSFKIDSITHNSVNVTVTPFEGGEIDPNTYEYYINESDTPIKVGKASELIEGLEGNTIYTITVKAKSIHGFYTGTLTRSFMTLQSPAIENAPDLTGFNPDTTYYLSFHGGTEIKTSIKEATPAGWYNYSKKEWANILTESNGRKTYLVWIPRYEYRINTLSGNDRGQMDIQFIPKTKTEATSGYIIHPAFVVKRNDTTQEDVHLDGIWVSKFEATDIKLKLTSMTLLPQIDGRSVKVTVTKPDSSPVVADSYEYYLNDDTTPVKVGTASETLTGLLPNTIYTIRVRAKDSQGGYTAYIAKSTTTLSAPDETVANEPDLTGFNQDTTYYITYEGGVENKTSIKQSAPQGWYDYNTKKWANILVENNGRKTYLVWIPRYQYKIQTVAPEYGLFDIRFIETSKTTADSGYIIHPAFTVGRSDTSQTNVELSGIWVSKFEATDIKARLDKIIISEIYDTSVKVITTPFANGEIDPNTYEYYINDEASPRKIGTATDIIEGLSPNTIYTISVRAKSIHGNYTAKLTRSFMTTGSSTTNVIDKPSLIGFNPDTTYYLTFENGNEVKTSIKQPAPSNWYDYDNKQWANIITENNGKQLYLVWIPRYEYRIQNLEGNDRGQIDIKFIPVEQYVPDPGYIVHPAFSVDRRDIIDGSIRELTGIWVSKFEATAVAIRLKSFKVTSIAETSVSVQTEEFTAGQLEPNNYEYFINNETNPRKVGTANETITGLSPNTIYTIKVRGKSTTGIYTDYMTRSFTTIAGSTTANAPDLTGFNPNTTYYITYEGGVENKTSIKQAAPSNWYNYNNKEWANIMTENNGKKLYLVWIPRYEYKVQSLDGSDRGQMDIKFIPVSQKIADSGYILHPAFKIELPENMGETRHISGIWVSKFEATDIKARLEKLTVSEIYDTSVKVDTTPFTGGEIAANSYEYYINDEVAPRKIGTANEVITGLSPNTVYTITVKAKSIHGNYTAALTRAFTTMTQNSVPNAPDLTGFNPDTTYYLTYEGGVENRVSINNAPPVNWYDYNSKQWANIVTSNNGKEMYLVWIPRYEYKIQSLAGTDRGQVDIKFIPSSQTAADSGYTLHPAFTVDFTDNNGGIKHINGIWVSKFEATDIKNK